MKKFKFKLILIAVLIAIIISTGLYSLLSWSGVEKTYVKNILERPEDQLFGWQYPVAVFPEAGPVTEQIAYSTIRDPGGIPQGLPVRLKIPAISVDSAIEDALITPDGKMDVPYGSVNVAWFSLGPKPGREGSAVIGGHFGINDGVKFVFYDLDKLKVGDRIYVIDDNGKTLAFQVRRIELFERNADATTVFTSNDGLAHLNLITCEGIWNRVNDTYPLRRVVFTDAISAEGAAEASATFFRPLSIGKQGADVAELQTVLVEKGFLIMPIGVSKGYFGALTSAAVVKYQVSVGLSSTGIFNFSTRDKLIPATTEGAVEAKATFLRPLSIGNQGADVAELQTVLVEKGFLIMPIGVSKGYFGALTSAAVVKYQVSVGLPSTSTFDSATRAKLIPAPEVVREPTLPSTSITPKSQSFSRDIIENIKSLYATPMDGLVTFILIILTISLAVKIIF